MDITAIKDIIININTKITTIEATIIVETDSTEEAIITVIVISIFIIIVLKYQPTIYIITIITNTQTWFKFPNQSTRPSIKHILHIKAHLITIYPVTIPY
jgi:hypothetical protein